MESIAFMVLLGVMGVVTGRTTDSPSVLALNELLSNADPLHNEVFYEPIPDHNTNRVPSRGALPNPAFHIVKSFSRPHYLDASVFRSQKDSNQDFLAQDDTNVGPETLDRVWQELPPYADINRQLTLMSASKSFKAPVLEDLLPVARDDEPLALDESSFPQEQIPRASPLFREFVEQTQKLISNRNPAVPLDLTFADKDEMEQIETSFKPFETTSEDVPADESFADYQEAEGEMMSGAVGKEEPLVHSLSPLAHILAGFRGEMGPFGGDHSTDRFMSSFRPEDF